MRRAGLTLIELLVTLFILGLVMAIIVPVMGKVRAQGRTAVCASNIRQIQIAMMSYDTEHQTLPPGKSPIVSLDQLPPGGRAGGGNDGSGWWWFHYLDFKTPGRDLKTILKCPDNKNVSSNVLLYNYGVNLSICKGININKPFEPFTGRSLSATGIRNASRAFLIGDSGYAVITWWHVMEDPPETLNKEFGNIFTAYIPGLSINKYRDIWSYQMDDAIKGRHPGKTVNIGFVDGHMERKKAELFLVEPLVSEPNQFHNLTPLWVPE